MNKKFFKNLLIILFTMTISSYKTAQEKEATEVYPVYNGDDLGVNYAPDETKFRVWAPSAESIEVKIYDQGMDGVLLETHQMEKDVNGTWLLKLEGDWKNKYYTYQATIDGEKKLEVPDPYARAVGVNGMRGMIVDLDATDPEGWNNTENPPMNEFTDIVIWEIHMRDFSVHPSSGIKNKGKYLAFTEKGTTSPRGHKTGLDHIVELGVTHVHLLPVFDFHTIDETKLHEPQFNWGYDPQNYNVPEGSYSTNPFDGNVRIREFKQMVKALQDNGIRVIMDVVYNHLYDAGTSSFENLVPGYYFRLNEDGTYCNGSGCGNETASEKAMMRKFMIESVRYWAEEYRINGFRFDLMALHDVETMNQIRAELDKVDPSIVIYGEGWAAGETPLPEEERASKFNVTRLNGIAVFSDDIRDGIRGPWWEAKEPGFMAGQHGLEESIKFGVVASTEHPGIDYPAVNYSDSAYSEHPTQTVTYVTCHDNPCLWDKILETCIDCTKDDKLNLQKLANAIVLTSQGIAFLHAGEELVRTKFGEHNTYNLPDSVNQLVWRNKNTYRAVFDYYKDLIDLRKAHPAFRMTDSEMIREHLTFLEFNQPLLVGFHLKENANNDQWKDILVYYNANPNEVEIELPPGEWIAVANQSDIDKEGLKVDGFNEPFVDKANIQDRSMLILVDKGSI